MELGSREPIISEGLDVLTPCQPETGWMIYLCLQTSRSEDISWLVCYELQWTVVPRDYYTNYILKLDKYTVLKGFFL